MNTNERTNKKQPHGDEGRMIWITATTTAREKKWQAFDWENENRKSIINAEKKCCRLRQLHAVCICTQKNI